MRLYLNNRLAIVILAVTATLPMAPAMAKSARTINGQACYSPNGSNRCITSSGQNIGAPDPVNTGHGSTGYTGSGHTSGNGHWSGNSGSGSIDNQHDDAGRLISNGNSGSGRIDNRHDDAGRLISNGNSGSGRIDNRHDDAGRLISSGSDGSGRIDNRHDDAGRLISSGSDGSGRIDRYHDDAGRRTDSGSYGSGRISRDHDDAGRRIDSGSYSSGRISRDHDDAGRYIGGSTGYTGIDRYHDDAGRRIDNGYSHRHHGYYEQPSFGQTLGQAAVLGAAAGIAEGVTNQLLQPRSSGVTEANADNLVTCDSLGGTWIKGTETVRGQRRSGVFCYDDSARPLFFRTSGGDMELP